MIQVKDDGKVIVRAPLRIPDQAIQDTIDKYRNWIIAKRKLAEERKKDVPAETFNKGDLFYFLGEKYPLVFREDLPADIVFDKAFYTPPAPPAFVKKRLEAWCNKGKCGGQAQNICYGPANLIGKRNPPRMPPNKLKGH